MVVVGIIGLLASVAVPVCTQVRRAAKIAEIKANLKAIQDATQAYCVVNSVPTANCTNIGALSLVPAYLSAWPSPGTTVDSRDSYSLNASGVAAYRGTFTFNDLYSPANQTAALAAAGY